MRIESKFEYFQKQVVDLYLVLKVLKKYYRIVKVWEYLKLEYFWPAEINTLRKVACPIAVGD